MIEDLSYNICSRKDNSAAQEYVFQAITHMFVRNRDIDETEVTSFMAENHSKQLSQTPISVFGQRMNHTVPFVPTSIETVIVLPWAYWAFLQHFIFPNYNSCILVLFY